MRPLKNHADDNRLTDSRPSHIILTADQTNQLCSLTVTSNCWATSDAADITIVKSLLWPNTMSSDPLNFPSSRDSFWNGMQLFKPEHSLFKNSDFSLQVVHVDVKLNNTKVTKSNTPKCVRFIVSYTNCCILISDLYAATARLFMKSIKWKMNKFFWHICGLINYIPLKLLM